MIELRIEDGEFERLSNIFGRADPVFRQAVKAAVRRAGGNMRKNVGKGIRGASYLKGKDVSAAIGSLKFAEGGLEAGLLVRSINLPAHAFRLLPRKITARKGVLSRKWKEPKFQISPRLKPIYAERHGGDSRGFVFRSKHGGNLVMGQRGLNKEGEKNVVKTVRGVSVQYFAVFDEVKTPVLDEAEQTFLKRLNHELDYRLGVLR